MTRSPGRSRTTTTGTPLPYRYTSVTLPLHCRYTTYYDGSRPPSLDAVHPAYADIALRTPLRIVGGNFAPTPHLACSYSTSPLEKDLVPASLRSDHPLVVVTWLSPPRAVWCQPASRRWYVTASVTYGHSLRYIRLQVPASFVSVDEVRCLSPEVLPSFTAVFEQVPVRDVTVIERQCDSNVAVMFT